MSDTDQFPPDRQTGELPPPGHDVPVADTPGQPDWEPITDPEDDRLTDVPPGPVDDEGKPLPNPFAGKPVDPYAPRPGDVYGELIEHAEREPRQSPWLPEDPQAQRITEQIRELEEARQRQLAEPAGNVDVHGAPHFARLAVADEQGGETVEVCGQDGQPWPCDTYRAMEEEADARLNAPHSADDEPEDMRVMRAAATAAGIDLDAFLAQQAQGRGAQ